MIRHSLTNAAQIRKRTTTRGFYAHARNFGDLAKEQRGQTFKTSVALRNK